MDSGLHGHPFLPEGCDAAGHCQQVMAHEQLRVSEIKTTRYDKNINLTNLDTVVLKVQTCVDFIQLSMM